MEQTRSAIQDKLETLEEKVTQTVQEATDTVAAVTESVATVKETVESTVSTVTGSVEQTVAAVTGSVEQTVAAVTGGMENTVQSVKQTLDLPYQVREHPWAMFLGATAIGFVATKLLERPAAALVHSAPVSNMTGYTQAERPSTSRQPRAARASEPAKPAFNWLGSLAGHYSKELDMLKKLAIATVGGVVREAATAQAPPAMADRVRQVIDGITEKLGAEPIEGPVLDWGSKSESSQDNQDNKDRESWKPARNVSMG